MRKSKAIRHEVVLRYDKEKKGYVSGKIMVQRVKKGVNG
jgi:hypothetical protein